MGSPVDADVGFPGYGDPEGRISTTRAAVACPENPVTQRLYRPIVPGAILHPPIHWLGGGVSCETGFADITLPACTQLERDDIGEWGEPGGQTRHGNSGCNFRVVVRMKKCISPLWESKSDYKIFTLLAGRSGVEAQYTEGNTDRDWARKIFEISDLPKRVSWEALERKGYHLINAPEHRKATPGLRWFAEGRACDTPDPRNPKRGTVKARELGTDSGKIEFVSGSLHKVFPGDTQRPPMPHFIPSWEGHQSPRAATYPLQLLR